MTHGDLPALTPEQHALVVSVTRLAHAIVRELLPGLQPAVQEEAVGVALHGASLAAQRFRPGGETRFASYAAPWMAGAVRRWRDREMKQTEAKRRASIVVAEYLGETPDAFDVSWDSQAVNHARVHDEARRALATMHACVALGPPDPEHAAAAAERRAWLEARIQEMPEGKAALVRLRVLEGWTAGEAMAELKINERTARRWMQEAMDALSEAVRALGLDEAS